MTSPVGANRRVSPTNQNKRQYETVHPFVVWGQEDSNLRTRRSGFTDRWNCHYPIPPDGIGVYSLYRHKGSNLDYQNQNLVCYHYTMSECLQDWRGSNPRPHDRQSSMLTNYTTALFWRYRAANSHFLHSGYRSLWFTGNPFPSITSWLSLCLSARLTLPPTSGSRF